MKNRRKQRHDSDIEEEDEEGEVVPGEEEQGVLVKIDENGDLDAPRTGLVTAA